MKTKHEIKVESGIPIPQQAWLKSAIWPWRKMAVGDSFFIDGKRAVSARSSASNFAKRVKGFAFTTRIEGKGIRIWRVEAK